MPLHVLPLHRDAKSKAKQLADIRFHEFSQCLYDAVNLQTHIVSCLIARAEHVTNGAFNMFDDSAHEQQPTISVSRPCSYRDQKII